ncbi:MAG TPA: SDR family oxidoreductase [Acidobacteriota bacterium]|nr:SDR family oxidoreductase [Acidobacteriota bacterium]
MHVKELLSLKGKVVLVTGGAGMYGRSIVQGVAEADATVITASRNLEAGRRLADEFASSGLDVHALQLDQSSHKSVLALKREIEMRFGGLDVFVNNAVSRPMRKYSDPLPAFEESMRVNATGMFDLLREMIDLMIACGGGSVVNIGSMHGVFGPDFTLYEATQDSPPDYHFHKGGMVALTHYLARRFGPQKIRVNCISPGGLWVDDPTIFPTVFVERYIQKTPLGRFAQHDDIKGVVVFLASEASAYITGVNILMDGGLHA